MQAPYWHNRFFTNFIDLAVPMKILGNYIVILFALFISGCEFHSSDRSSDLHSLVIAFGSCSHEYDSLQMWDEVLEHEPYAWIWMGDNIYGDTYDMQLMKKKYDLQKTRPSYQKLLASTKVFGIWDDHDFGINDGGRHYPMKDESKLLMLDFLDVPESNDVYDHEGAYQCYKLNSAGLKVKVILLDTRYFRDSLIINVNRPPNYLPNAEGTILGETQWQWLEEQLMSSEADVHLIGSSIQVIPDDQGYEKWGNFPAERQRLFDLIVKTAPKCPIILSGDRHIAEFSKIELEGLDYPLYEFTSSGLTHTWEAARAEPNRYRIGDMIINKNFGIIEISKSNNDADITMTAYGNQNKKLAETKAVY